MDILGVSVQEQDAPGFKDDSIHDDSEEETQNIGQEKPGRAYQLIGSSLEAKFLATSPWKSKNDGLRVFFGGRWRG